MSDSELTLPEEQAFQLSRCAIALSNGWEAKDRDLSALVSALNANLELWVAIRTMVMRDDCSLSAAAKENLRKLAEFVAGKTFEGVDKVAGGTIQTLVNINLQIAEGVLEGAKVPA